MNKQQIYKIFKRATLTKTFFDLADYMNYLHYRQNIPFDEMDNITEVKPITQKGLTWDIKTTTIKDYDKINGAWIKTDLALYEVQK